MLKLTGDQIEHGFACIKHHGYGSFFPSPSEIDIISNDWGQIRDHLSSIDLDTYKCYEPLSTFVPKSYLNIRSVSLLHPFDLILYTSLVHSFKKDIALARLSPQSHRVFSFRSEGTPDGVLYKLKPSYGAFRRRLQQKTRSGKGYIGVADIADFYPLIYQHRLVNALQATLTEPTRKPLVRVLEKLLCQFSKGASYGIPVGPVASRPLGEAVLIDVDSALRSFGANFMRYVDDHVFVTKSAESAVATLHYLAECLFSNYGLTLQTAKTKVLTRMEYRKQYLIAPGEKEKERRKLLSLIMEVGEDGDYEIVPYEDLSDDQRNELDAINLSDLLTEALAHGENIDYKEVSFILGRISALQKPDLIPIVLKNLKKLYPVSHSIASFFGKFTALDASDKKKIAEALLRPLLTKRGPAPPTYYAIWILHLFFQNANWDHANSLLRIYNNSSSHMIRRYAALAISSSGSRAHAIALKDDFIGAPPLLRTAILLASSRLGDDERRFWIRNLGLSDQLEKRMAQSAPAGEAP